MLTAVPNTDRRQINREDMDAYQEQTREGRKKSLTAYADQIKG